MDRKQLKEELDKLGIGETNYVLAGPAIPNRIIMSHSNPHWIIYFYDERGNVSEVKQFDTEEKACDDMLARLIYVTEWRKKYGIK